jgi:NAD(P)-dependent dehydrogenase (short-subunit alcohol dehydrogenase family)
MMTPTSEKNQLRGKVVLITGAGSGLGEATAQAFARAGSIVACCDIDAAAARRVSDALSRDDAQSTSLACDVSDEQAVFDSVEQIASQFDRLDIVVNCAAVDHTVSVEEMTVAQWDQVIGVNLRGPFLVAKAALPIMRRQGGGHIFNIASTAATRAWANAAAYHASKWGLVGFGRGLGVEGRADHVRVTTVIPGGMRTHFFDRFVEQGIPLPDEANLQDPANVASVIVFAAMLPPESNIPEVMVMPLTETSWP